MLIGAAGNSVRDRIARAACTAGDPMDCTLIGRDDAFVAVKPWRIETLDAAQRHAEDPASGSWLSLSGHLFLDTEPKSKNSTMPASQLLALITAQGLKALDAIDGNFAVAWYDGPSHRLHLIRDRFGIEPLFYGLAQNDIVFGSRIEDMLQTGMLPNRLDKQGLLEFLTYCYIPGNHTLNQDIYRVPAGSVITVAPGRGIIRQERWYRISFAQPFPGDEAEICSEYLRRLELAVRKRLSKNIPGALLSGGMDSSSVVTLIRRNRSGPIHTYAFRCAGHSFDESIYARAVANEMNTEHREVQYGEAQATEIENAVQQMDVPFCDIGIEIGTWLLGKEAAGDVSYLLTGDGGDELWGSHPVYAAQRVMQWYDRINLFPAVHRSILKLTSLLHDSDRKRDFRVVVKRLLPSDQIPKELGPFRWRIYYGDRDLKKLLAADRLNASRDHDPFQCVLDQFEGYDGPDDGLSRYLFNDYATASSFYFSRLQLARHFGLEARCPFYDRSLVEFGARIPARLKLEGIERTKRLFRKAMQGVVPDVITQRKDKLGHSVPLKNWVRHEGSLSRRIEEVLSEHAIKARGLFNPGAVRDMLEEHRRLRHNHSHRIWALYVLELWLRARKVEV